MSKKKTKNKKKDMNENKKHKLPKTTNKKSLKDLLFNNIIFNFFKKINLKVTLGVIVAGTILVICFILFKNFFSLKIF